MTASLPPLRLLHDDAGLWARASEVLEQIPPEAGEEADVGVVTWTTATGEEVTDVDKESADGEEAEQVNAEETGGEKEQEVEGEKEAEMEVVAEEETGLADGADETLQ